MVKKIIAIQCKMARAALGLGVRELAELAAVSQDTVSRLERGEELMPRTLEAVQRALEASGVEFTNGDEPGVKLRKGFGMNQQFSVEKADNTSILVLDLTTADRFSFAIRDRKFEGAATYLKRTGRSLTAGGKSTTEPIRLDTTQQNQARSFALEFARARGWVD